MDSQSKIFIVSQTTCVRQAPIARALSMGVVDFISKLFTLHDIPTRINTCLFLLPLDELLVKKNRVLSFY